MRFIYAFGVTMVMASSAMAQCAPGQSWHAAQASGNSEAAAQQQNWASHQSERAAQREAANGNYGASVNSEINSVEQHDRAAADNQRARADDRAAHHDVAGCW